MKRNNSVNTTAAVAAWPEGYENPLAEAIVEIGRSTRKKFFIMVASNSVMPSETSHIAISIFRRRIVQTASTTIDSAIANHELPSCVASTILMRSTLEVGGYKNP